MARTSNTADDGDQAAAAPETSPPAPGGHNVTAGVPVGEASDISKAVGVEDGAPAVLLPAPMYWMRSVESGNVYPAFNLGKRDELATNGCEQLPVDQTPEGMPDATGMTGTGLLA